MNSQRIIQCNGWIGDEVEDLSGEPIGDPKEDLSSQEDLHKRSEECAKERRADEEGHKEIVEEAEVGELVKMIEQEVKDCDIDRQSQTEHLA